METSPFRVFVLFEIDQDELRDILLLMRKLSFLLKGRNKEFPLSQYRKY